MQGLINQSQTGHPRNPHAFSFYSSHAADSHNAGRDDAVAEQNNAGHGVVDGRCNVGLADKDCVVEAVVVVDNHQTNLSHCGSVAMVVPVARNAPRLWRVQ